MFASDQLAGLWSQDFEWKIFLAITKKLQVSTNDFKLVHDIATHREEIAALTGRTNSDGSNRKRVRQLRCMR